MTFNEFGEIGLDHELIESSEEDLVELSTGCICCVMRGDLQEAIERLMVRQQTGKVFDRIILETTGLADPGPILHSLIYNEYLIIYLFQLAFLYLILLKIF